MPLINRIMPFFIAAIVLTCMVFGFVLLAYVMLFSAIIGMAFWLVNWVRAQLSTPKPTERTHQQGRIIDTDDWRKL